jgi:ribosomal protein L40E
MSPQFQATVVSSRFGWDSVECDLTLVLPGTVESLRPRLAGALEQLGYHVVSEEPLQAKRGGASFSLNVLRYPVALVVGFRPVGERAVQVTFSYSLTHSGMGFITRGDLAVLAREAEALAASAFHQMQIAVCGLCGSDNPRGSRFCRRCGAPLVAWEPAEVEIVQLAAQGRAAYRAIISGVIGLLLMTLYFVFLIVGSSIKIERGLVALGLIMGVIGWIPLLWGSYKLWETLKQRENKSMLIAGRRPTESFASPPLLTGGEPLSVTERTTQLLEESTPPKE